jgi:hypothetical protein
MVMLHQPTPILRIFDEAKAKEFYLDFLGFTPTFEHRFGGNFPLYMGVSHSGCELHLGTAGGAVTAQHASGSSWHKVSGSKRITSYEGSRCQYCRSRCHRNLQPALRNPISFRTAVRKIILDAIGILSIMPPPCSSRGASRASGGGAGRRRRIGDAVLTLPAADAGEIPVSVGAAPADVPRKHALGRRRGSARLATMSRPRGAR